jgi:hypothetical protein
MYFRKLASHSVIIALSIFLIACVQNPPIHNVEKQAIVAGEDLSMGQVETAIIRGGAYRDWSMRVVESGHIEGTLNLRSHEAIVDILYTTEDYSIVYKDSRDLGYEDGKIHRNYNKWIVNLNSDIQRELTHR